MPYLIEPVQVLYRVVNPITGKVHAKATTFEKAHSQVRLLRQKDLEKNINTNQGKLV